LQPDTHLYSQMNKACSTVPNAAPYWLFYYCRITETMRFRPQITGILTLKFALADTKCEVSKTTGQTPSKAAVAQW